jgi:hypothetical protein
MFPVDLDVPDNVGGNPGVTRIENAAHLFTGANKTVGFIYQQLGWVCSM